jgi:hypothetical protein
MGIKKEYKIRIATFLLSSEASRAAEAMVFLPGGWRCVAEEKDLVIYGPRRNCSYEISSRVNCFISGYRAGLNNYDVPN